MCRLLLLSALFRVTVLINGLTKRCPSWPTEKFLLDVREAEKCYFRSTWKTTWLDAKKACLAQGGVLAMIKTQAMNKVMLKVSRKGGYKWIGLSDHVEEGVWRWVDGSLMTYEDFEDVSPIDWLFSNNEVNDCATVCPYPFDTSRTVWLKFPCDDMRRFICEQDTIEVVQETIRKPRKQKLTVFRRFPNGFGCRLTARPDFVTRAFQATSCARECAKRLSPCALINFHQPSFTCRGYSSPDVIEIGKQEQEGWEIWQE